MDKRRLPTVPRLALAVNVTGEPSYYLLGRWDFNGCSWNELHLSANMTSALQVRKSPLQRTDWFRQLRRWGRIVVKLRCHNGLVRCVTSRISAHNTEIKMRTFQTMAASRYHGWYNTLFFHLLTLVSAINSLMISKVSSNQRAILKTPLTKEWSWVPATRHRGDSLCGDRQGWKTWLFLFHVETGEELEQVPQDV